MGDAADDAEFREEETLIMYYLHTVKRCLPDCPYCEIEREVGGGGGSRTRVLICK